MYESDEGRIDAAEQLAEHNPYAAAKAFSAIACDGEVGDEVRLSAAEQLAAVDPHAAARPAWPLLVTKGSATRCACPRPSSSPPSISALQPARLGYERQLRNDSRPGSEQAEVADTQER
jgi:hypothetical protein